MKTKTLKIKTSSMRNHIFFVSFETKSFVCFYPMQKKANNFFEVVIEYMYTVFGLFPVKDKRTPPSASKMYKIIFSFKSTD